MDESFLRQRRERMVRQLERRGIADGGVLDALRRVPRHRFIDRHLVNEAYTDYALPIAGGQTISQPWVVARMSELLEIERTHSVLEIGTGSGYQTAVLALLARWVYSLERIPELVPVAIERMRALGLDNVKIQRFDGSLGWSEAAPFDRIMVTAGAPGPPQPLLEQLADDGILLVPEGRRDEQRLVVYRRRGETIDRRERDRVAFVPLIGRHGWGNE